jgi:Protein of unknown function (DUF3584)
LNSITECYGLENIILHHSFKQVKGRTLKISCRERTHVGGKNGAGKTSILQLIPAFFGEEPERIVTRASGRDSFLGYYLPNLQSLVIFEYRRHSGLCCAVLYRHPQGKLCYRFVEGGVEDSFFLPEIREKLKNGATNDVVFQSLREAGVRVSAMIDTIMDYRAIIQRNPKLLKRQPAEAKRLRALANDYGLGGPSSHMSHIDRLTHVVLNKNRLLSSFKTMICETMFEIHLNKRPTILYERDLVNDIRSIKAFEKEESAIRECLLKDAERKGIYEQAARTVNRLRETVQEQEELKAELIGQKEELIFKMDEEKTEFSEKDGRLGKDISDTSHELDTRNTYLNKIFEQRDEYEDEGLPDLDQELNNLDEYRRKFRKAEQDLDTLTSKFSELESEHERNVRKIELEFEREQAQRQEKIQLADKALVKAVHAHEQTLSRLDNDLIKEESDYRESRHTKRSELDSERVRLETRRDNPSQTSEEQSQILEAEQALSLLKEGQVTLQEDRANAISKHEQACRNRSKAQESLKVAGDSVERLDSEFEELQRHLTPDADSWLAKLRVDDPRWGDGLAKVINPELVMRKDLNPVLSGTDTNTLMGWSLETDHLPTPPFAVSEDQIQARLEEKDQERRRARKVLDEAETYAGKCNGRFSEIGQEVEQIESQLTIHGNQIGNAQKHLSNVRRYVDEAMQQRKESIERELESVKEKLTEFDQETKKALKAIRDRFSRQRLEYLAQWSDKKAELTNEIDNLVELAEQAQKEFTERKKTLNKAYERHLKNEGVDPAEVKATREKKEGLELRIEKIEGSQSKVFEYRNWRKQEWSCVETLQTEFSTREKELETLKLQRNEITSAYKKAEKEASDQLQIYSKRIGCIKQDIEDAETILFKFEGADSGTIELPGNLKSLTEQLQDAYRQLDQLRTQVIKALRNATALLNRYENTQVHQAWRKLQEYQVSQLTNPEDKYTEDFELTQVDGLRILLDQDLPHLRYTLIDQFAGAAGELGDYFDSLQVLAGEVKQVSNLLKRAINTDQQIDSISDIQVVLQPRIYEDESWQPLKNFVDSWRNWQLSHRREIPTEVLVNDFHIVVTALRSARISNNVESMVDMSLTLVENDRQVSIRNDNDFLNASSTGLTYLAIMAVFMGLTRYLCPDPKIRITWPIDELGTLSANNISRLAVMMDQANLTMISACPKLDHGLRKFFENKISLKDGRVYIYGEHQTQQDPDQKKLFARLCKQQSTEEGESYAI